MFFRKKKLILEDIECFSDCIEETRIYYNPSNDKYEMDKKKYIDDDCERTRKFVYQKFYTLSEEDYKLLLSKCLNDILKEWEV